MSEVDLSIDLAGLHLNNPIIAASGTFGYGEEFERFTELCRIGGSCRQAQRVRRHRRLRTEYLLSQYETRRHGFRAESTADPRADQNAKGAVAAAGHREAIT